MKITGNNQVNSITQAYLGKVQKAQPNAGVDASRGKDTVEISSDASAIEAARKAIAAAPEIREAKIEALRQQIAEGTYQVSADEVAGKMIAETQLSQRGQS